MGINNVRIRAIEEFRCHDNEPLIHGSVYYNSTKLGEWSQDFSGGPDIYKFNNDVIKVPFTAWKVWLRDVGYRDYGYLTMDNFIDVCASVDLLYKDIKKFVKSGAKIIVYGINFVTGYTNMFGCPDKLSAQSMATSIIKELSLTTSDVNNDKWISIKMLELDPKSMPEVWNIFLGTAIDAEKFIRQQEVIAKVAQEKARLEAEDRAKKPTRFTCSSIPNEPRVVITDTKTGKKSIAPVYAFKETLRVLQELFD